jgi:hypothetical protein
LRIDGTGFAVTNYINATIEVFMLKTMMHPELKTLADNDSENRVIEWILFFTYVFTVIIMEWLGLKVPTLGEKLFYYGLIGALLFAMVMSFRLYRKQRFRRLSWLLYNTQPLAVRMLLHNGEIDNEPCIHAEIEPGSNLSAFPSLQKGVWVDVPDWDTSSMVGNEIVAQCYLHPRSKRCYIIRTEKGLLITQYPF